MTVAKIAGKIRGGTKVLVGAYASDSDANKHDGIDCVREANMQRGLDPTYAIPRDAINADLRFEGSSILRITGDEFCNNAETSLYLLADVNSAISGTALTNNGTITFASETTEDESPLFEYLIPSLNGSSQYFSLATEASVEVGTGSFIACIWFKNSTLGAAQTLFSYGDVAASEQNWKIEFTSANKIQAVADDGTSTSTVTDTIISRWQDGRWHCAIMMLDTSLATDTLFLWVDGQLIGSNAQALLTLNNPTESFYIGAEQTTSTIQQYFTGSLTNWHLIKAADYNALAVLNNSIRESVISGVIPVPVADSAKRMNSKVIFPATANCYTTCVGDLEDGEYEIQIAYERQAAGGTLSLLVDDKELVNLSTDGSAGSNIISKTYRKKIAAGRHLIKIKNTEANTIPLQWISFIKRKGHELGGCTEFLLLGDEIIQRENAAWETSLAVATADYLNNRFTENTNGDLTEGDLFFKGGLWLVEIAVREDTTNAGKIDFDIGSVEILDALLTSATTNIVVTRKYVRLNQGKQNVRVAVVTGTGTPTIRVMSIRGVRISD